MSAPAVGQVWQDWDYRYRDKTPRLYRIARIGGGGYAWMTLESGPPLSRKTTRVAVNRLKPTSTGWKLVEDAS